jgi:hypothetical protein
MLLLVGVSALIINFVNASNVNFMLLPVFISYYFPMLLPVTPWRIQAKAKGKILVITSPK